MDVPADLVEYFIVSVPSVDALALLRPALDQMVRHSSIRILDAVVLVKDGDGVLTVLEPDAVDELAGLADLAAAAQMLSDRDLALAATALAPGSAAVIIVSEDRWAEPLSSAAQRAGGRIIAGERIPPGRVGPVQDRADLLARPPSTTATFDEGWSTLIVDHAAQLTALADLVVRGLLSREEYEHHKAKVLDRRGWHHPPPGGARPPDVAAS